LLRGQELKLNEAEFVDYKWLGVDQALDLYKKDELALFGPQVNMLSSLYFYQQSYSELKKMATKTNSNPLSYITNKPHWFNLFDKDDKEIGRQVHRMFSDYDL